MTDLSFTGFRTVEMAVLQFRQCQKRTLAPVPTDSKAPMKTLQVVLTALTLASSALLTSAASADTRRSGESPYGQLAVEAKNARVVDVMSTKSASVTYGETILFQGAGGKTFAWTFSGLDGRSWSLKQFAPSGFVAKDYRVYVAGNQLYRR
jgi:hypothetical protein